ncbi:MAG: ABC transporter ATP-binding protein [Ilumatobacteraceae bacterium]|nr:ABC transporter ATP-binding protein [Ilumatobacteraceae bacterium]
MTNVGVPMERSKDFGTTSRRLMRRMSQENALVVLVLLLALCSVTLVVIGPRILGHATDVVFDGLLRRNGQEGISFGKLHGILWLALLLYVISFALAYAQSYIMSGVVQRTMYQLRQDVEAKLHRLPLSYVDANSRGDLLSRVTNDIDNIAQSMQQSLSGLLTSLLTIVGVIVMMFIISPVLALIAMLMVPSSLITMKQIAARSKTRFIAQWTQTGKLNGLVEEAFTGHAIVKAFGRQQEVENRFAIINDELHDASFGAQFVSGAIQPAMMFIGNLNYVAIAVVGGVRVASGTMGLGDIQAFIQYSRLFTAPLTQTASMMNVLQSGIASAERVFELLDAQEQSPDADSRVDETSVKGRVEFIDVGFSYNKEMPLIQSLCLIAEPGTTVAIVGPTGAGKTTLVNLLMRFYELDKGSITLDGHDISKMPRNDLRSNIGMVLQDTWLFGGTIRENIAYGNPFATEAEIMDVARATFVDRFVHSLPEGYETILNDEGGSVSAGEKQLLTIARAFLANPTILILDEATSSVDTRTEVLIQRAMTALRSQRTSFVIAHRLSTIRDADVILMMEKGRIVEQGSHEELLAAHGAYYGLHQSQFAAPAQEII